MSRIDQALSKAHSRSEETSDVVSDDPWAIDAPAATEPPATSLPPATSAPERVEVPSEPPLDLRQPGVEDLPLARGLSEKVVGGQLPPHVVEEYRRLGALVHHMQVERDVRVVMMTSAVAGEGKTLSATNLALTLSASYGRRVLLIDADLRRPSLDRVFNIVTASGLSDLLRDAGVAPPLIQITPRLTLLAAGRPDADPLHGLTSPRMRQLLLEARETFDFVIIDTPPVGLLTDANLLASMIDAAFLVVRAGSTPFEHVKRAADAIGRSRIAGVILNRASAKEAQADHYAGYYGDYSKPRSV